MLKASNEILSTTDAHAECQFLPVFHRGQRREADLYCQVVVALTYTVEIAANSDFANSGTTEHLDKSVLRLDSILFLFLLRLDH